MLVRKNPWRKVTTSLQYSLALENPWTGGLLARPVRMRTGKCSFEEEARETDGVEI